MNSSTSGLEPLRWHIGAVTVTRILEQETALPASILLPEASAEALANIDWLRPHYIDDAGNLRLSIHALVVETATRLVVIDTCVGNDKQRLAPVFNQLQGDFLQRFCAAGFHPEKVDTVLCTHLHTDHVGWNTRLVDGRWQPTFPNARYLLGREEVAHWRAHGTADDERAAFADSIQPLFDAGLVDTVETSHRICDEIALIPTPGHTPGHVSVSIQSGDDRALITGDIVHNPAQLAHPEWCCFIDHAPQQAIATRRHIFDEIADGPTLVIGTHFVTPTAGRVSSDGDSWRFDQNGFSQHR